MSEPIGRPVSIPPQCDHDAGIHLRPVVLVSWREGDLVIGISRYARMRCYACGKTWLEYC